MALVLRPAQAVMAGSGDATAAPGSSQEPALTGTFPAALPPSIEPRYLSHQVVLVGHGELGRRVARDLSQRGIPFVVVEHLRERVEALRGQRIPAVLGEAGGPTALVQAHGAGADLMVVTLEDKAEVLRAIEVALVLKPGLPIVAYAPGPQEAQVLRAAGARVVLQTQDALAWALVRDALAALGPSSATGPRGSAQLSG